ncbi:hypothetical protein MPSEU_000531200 [Mayamaea pseudoterrestris]|nr:hypothetical protein MPSEU_000531200 [Mayamaea pseudoterrestris]
MGLLWKYVWVLVLPLMQLQLAIYASSNAEPSTFAVQEREAFGLRVTLRADHLERAPSCVYTFAQLELLNLDSTDYVDILSIRVAKEETILVQHGKEDKRDKIFDTQLPKQLHVSSLPADTLSLGPGQVAIVPVTFLPRFPVRKPVTVDHHLSFARQIDLEEWFQQRWDDIMTVSDDGPMSSTRSNQWHYMARDTQSSYPPDLHNQILFEEYKVSTQMIVETNRGIVAVPIQVSSMRENDYGLPPAIRFASSLRDNNQPNDSYLDALYYSETAAFASRLQQPAIKHGSVKPQHVKQHLPSANIPCTLHPKYRVATRQLATPKRAAAFSNENTAASDDSMYGVLAARRLQRNDCYNVYLKHPSRHAGSVTNDRRGENKDSQVFNENDGAHGIDPIFVLRVSLRNAMSLGLVVLPEEGKWQQKDNSPLLLTVASQSIDQFTESGPLQIPADGLSHYVCTVCPTSSTDFWAQAYTNEATGDNISEDVLLDGMQQHLTETAKAANSLGFLQIRTDTETLIVTLEKASSEGFDGDEDSKENVDDDDREEIGNESLESHSVVDKRRAGLYVSYNVTNADSREEALGTTDESVSEPERNLVALNDGDVPVYHKDDDDDEWQGSLLLADPESIDIHLLSSASHTARVPIDVYNAGSVQSVTIMRMSAIWSSSEPDLDERIGFKVTLPGEGLDDRITINFNETLEDAFFFQCSIDWDKFSRDQLLSDIHFSGSVILRGSTREWKYEDWESATKVHPFMDSDLVLEIPFSVTIIKGKIGFVLEQTTYPQSIFWLMEPWKEHVSSVCGAFFPLTPADLKRSFGREDIESFIAHERMDHQLRVFSNVDIETEVQGVEIVDDVVYREGRSNRLTDSICEHFEVSFTDSRSDRQSDPFGLSDHRDLGLVHLTYYFKDEAADATKDFLNNRTIPTVCYLRLTTEPDTGNHLTPLIVYSASVEVSGYTFQADAASADYSSSEDQAGTVWQRTIVGFEKLLGWVQSTKSGGTLRSVLDASLIYRRFGRESDSELLGRYLYQLADHSLHSDYSKLRPILLEAGAIAQGELETFPLYLTNHNPVAIKAMIDVGEVEGMSISVGRETSGKGDGHNLLDHLPRKPVVRRARLGGSTIFEPLVESGHYQGHPINGLRQFLLSDESAGKYLSQFPYRDAISQNDVAIARVPLLDKLYREYAVVDFHRSPLPDHFSSNYESLCGQTQHPPLYGEFDSSWTGHSGPFIIATDGRTRRLPVCWSRERRVLENALEGTTIMLPPGGSIRFDVNLRAPPNSVLEKDITQFLATGLVVSTDHGDIMPIFVSFEALQGKLDITHIPSSQNVYESDMTNFEDRVSAIRVPIALFRQASLPLSPVVLTIPPFKTSSDVSAGIATTNVSRTDVGIPLYMKSSFSRDVRLREITSCNPWFQVELNNNSEMEPDPYFGINIGTVKSMVSCEDSFNNVQANATGFFRCALSWLAKRSELQPRGCGMKTRKERESTLDVNGNAVAERTYVERAIRAFKRVLLVDESIENHLQPEYDESSVPIIAFKSGRRRVSGVVPDYYVDAVADAWDSWKSVSELGLRKLSTSLRAVIEYSTGINRHPDRTHILSLALPNLTIESVLDPPTLLDKEKLTGSLSQHFHDVDALSTIVFPGTQVAGIAMVFLPLTNPTGVPVRVKLAVTSSRRSIRNDFRRELETENIGVDSDVLDRYLGDLQPPYVQTGATERDGQTKTFNDYWWTGDGAFMLAGFEGDVTRSYHNATIVAGAGAQISICTPSLLGNTALLAGCGPGCGVRQEIPKHQAAASNPIGASASVGITLSGRRRYRRSYEKYAVSDSRIIQAGGLLRSGGAGPSAFALPYSSLDEVVIPPYGTAELGPILFRPPGRFNSLGCEAKVNSGLAGSCTNNVFAAMVLLENSLTGLERVKLQGEALWQKIVFLDPVKPDDSQSFGDIELRDGSVALIFSGVGVDARPDIKEVVVANKGNTNASITSIFFTHTSIKRATIKSNGENANCCSFRNFYLIDCELFKNGFTLEPGHNRSIYIMHKPDCFKRKEFIALNLELNRSTYSTIARQPLTSIVDASSESSLLYFGGARLGRANWVSQSMQPARATLHIGYDMTKALFATCRSNEHAVKHTAFREGGGVFYEFEYNRERSYCAVIELLTILFIFGFTIFLLPAFDQRRRSSIFFSSTLIDGRKQCNDVGHQQAELNGANWMAAFRCLARADPSPSDLNTLAREQVRHIVLSRYRMKEILPPQCLTSTGAFHRDNGNAVTGRQPQGVKSISNASERIRTISDAIFHRYRARSDDETGLLPCDLGWRTAVARGIINTSSARRSFISTATDTLIGKRQAQASGTNDSSYDSDVQTDSEEESVLSSSSSESATVATNANRARLYSQPQTKILLAEAKSNFTDNIIVREVNVAAEASVDKTSVSASMKLVSHKDRASNRAEESPEISKRLYRPAQPPQAASGDDVTHAVATSKVLPPKLQLIGTEAPLGVSSSSITRPLETDELIAQAALLDTKMTQTHAPGRFISQIDGTHPSRRTASKSRHMVAEVSEMDRLNAEPAIKINEIAERHEKRDITAMNAKSGVLDHERATNEKTKLDSFTNKQTQARETRRVAKADESKRKGRSKGTHQRSNDKGGNDDQAKTSPLTVDVVIDTSIESQPPRETNVFPDNATESQRVTSPLRPPPGLVPPPGFGQTISSDSAAIAAASSILADTKSFDYYNAFADTVSQSISIDSGEIGPSSPLISNRSSPDTSLRYSADRQRQLDAEDLYDDRRLYQEPLTEGFNVLDFLDNILNDGSNVVYEDETEALVAEADDILSSDAPLIASNPWAASTATETSVQSRLSAYGISIDDSSDRPGDDSLFFVTNNLLTPADILAADADNDADARDLLSEANVY